MSVLHCWPIQCLAWVLYQALECNVTSEWTVFNTKHEQNKLPQSNYVTLRFETPIDHSEETLTAVIPQTLIVFERLQWLLGCGEVAQDRWAQGKPWGCVLPYLLKMRNSRREFTKKSGLVEWKTHLVLNLGERDGIRISSQLEMGLLGFLLLLWLENKCFVIRRWCLCCYVFLCSYG